MNFTLQDTASRGHCSHDESGYLYLATCSPCSSQALRASHWEDFAWACRAVSLLRPKAGAGPFCFSRKAILARQPWEGWLAFLGCWLMRSEEEGSQGCYLQYQYREESYLVATPAHGWNTGTQGSRLEFLVPTS